MSCEVKVTKVSEKLCGKVIAECRLWVPPRDESEYELEPYNGKMHRKTVGNKTTPAKEAGKIAVFASVNPFDLRHIARDDPYDRHEFDNACKELDYFDRHTHDVPSFFVEHGTLNNGLEGNVLDTGVAASSKERNLGKFAYGRLLHAVKGYMRAFVENVKERARADPGFVEGLQGAIEKLPGSAAEKHVLSDFLSSRREFVAHFVSLGYIVNAPEPSEGVLERYPKLLLATFDGNHDAFYKLKREMYQIIKAKK